MKKHTRYCIHSHNGIPTTPSASALVNSRFPVVANVRPKLMIAVMRSHPKSNKCKNADALLLKGSTLAEKVNLANNRIIEKHCETREL